MISSEDNNGQHWTTICGATCTSEAVFIYTIQGGPWVGVCVGVWGPWVGGMFDLCDYSRFQQCGLLQIHFQLPIFFLRFSASDSEHGCKIYWSKLLFLWTSGLLLFWTIFLALYWFMKMNSYLAVGHFSESQSGKWDWITSTVWAPICTLVIIKLPGHTKSIWKKIQKHKKWKRFISIGSKNQVEEDEWG